MFAEIPAENIANAEKVLMIAGMISIAVIAIALVVWLFRCAVRACLTAEIEKLTNVKNDNYHNRTMCDCRHTTFQGYMARVEQLEKKQKDFEEKMFEIKINKEP